MSQNYDGRDGIRVVVATNTLVGRFAITLSALTESIRERAALEYMGMTPGDRTSLPDHAITLGAILKFVPNQQYRQHVEERARRRDVADVRGVPVEEANVGAPPGSRTPQGLIPPQTLQVVMTQVEVRPEAQQHALQEGFFGALHDRFARMETASRSPKSSTRQPGEAGSDTRPGRRAGRGGIFHIDPWAGEARIVPPLRPGPFSIGSPGPYEAPPIHFPPTASAEQDASER